MASRDELLAEATGVLTAVTSNDTARALFVSSYSGPGDAVAELTIFVHSSTGDAKRAALRATAFGRADTAEDEARALRARETLEALDATERTRADAVALALDRYDTAASAAPSSSSTITASAPDSTAPPAAPQQDPAAPSGRPRFSRRGTALIAAAAFLVGGLVTTGITVATNLGRPAVTTGVSGTNGATTAPGEPVSSDAGLLQQMNASRAGNVRAANSLLRREAFNADVITGMVGDYIDRSSTRRLFGQGSTIVYAARGEGSDYCLILKLGDVSTWSCNGPDQFAANGLEVELKASADHEGPSTAARWNGIFVEVVRVPPMG